ncbi:MAG: hypothetical protein M3R38_37880 [Actinomycetota bacterium]|nr:hypothetical protein [Actinomycetota bacterium]
MHDLLLKKGELVLGVFDVRFPGAYERACRERNGWKGFARFAWLDECRAVLVVRPGGASRLLNHASLKPRRA